MRMLDDVHEVLAHEVFGPVWHKAASTQAICVLEQTLGQLERNSVLANLPHTAHLALQVAVQRELQHESIKRPDNARRFSQLVEVRRHPVHERSLSKRQRYWNESRHTVGDHALRRVTARPFDEIFCETPEEDRRIVVKRPIDIRRGRVAASTQQWHRVVPHGAGTHRGYYLRS